MAGTRQRSPPVLRRVEELHAFPRSRGGADAGDERAPVVQRDQAQLRVKRCHPRRAPRAARRRPALRLEPGLPLRQHQHVATLQQHGFMVPEWLGKISGARPSPSLRRPDLRAAKRIVAFPAPLIEPAPRPHQAEPDQRQERRAPQKPEESEGGARHPAILPPQRPSLASPSLRELSLPPACPRRHPPSIPRFRRPNATRRSLRRAPPSASWTRPGGPPARTASTTRSPAASSISSRPI